MKKKVFLCITLFFSLVATVSAQLSSLGHKIGVIPDHIEARLSHYDRIIPPNGLIKNVSYDTPMKIERYAVSAMGVQTLDQVFELTYLPGGQLRTQTRMNGMLINQARVIYNYNGVGEVGAFIYQLWDGANWEFDYRELRTYTSEGYLASVLYEVNNAGDWIHDGEYRFTYESAGANTTALILTQSIDGLTWQEYVRVVYNYDGESTPSEILITIWDEDILSYIPFQKWEISNWGPKPFKPDFYFHDSRDNYKITDLIINKASDTDVNYPPADFILFGNYNFADGTFGNQINIHSTYVDNNRTEFTQEVWNGTTYEPANRTLLQYDECYGYSGKLTQQHTVPTGWQLNGGALFVGETVPYNESCYVTAYNFYTNFSIGNPTGDWTRRWVIDQFPNLSLNEKELNNSLQVFPNPSSDEVTINFTGELTADFQLSLIGLDGKVIYTSNMSSSILKVDMAQFPAGMYALILENAYAVLTEKIVKR